MTTHNPLLGQPGSWLNPGRALRIPRERAVSLWANLAEATDPADVAPAFLSRSVARFASLDAPSRALLARAGNRTWARAVCDEAIRAVTIARKFYRAGQISAFLADLWLPVAPIRELHAIREGVLADHVVAPHAPMTHGLLAATLNSESEAILLHEEVERVLRHRAAAMCADEGVDDFRNLVRGTKRARETGVPLPTPEHLTDEQWMLLNHGPNWYVGGQ